MTGEQLKGLILAAHSAKEFKDGITKNFTLQDYRSVVDADYVRHPLFAAMTYAGVRPVSIPALGAVARSGASHDDPSIPGEEKSEYRQTVGATAELQYYYSRMTLDRLDLIGMGDELLISLIQAMRASVEMSILNNQIGRSGLWNDPLTQTTGYFADNVIPGSRAWLMGGADELLSFMQGLQITNTETLRELLGYERIQPVASGWTHSKVIIADPAAFYWCGEREPSVYIDENSKRVYNQITLVVEQAVGIAYDPARVKVYEFN